MPGTAFLQVDNLIFMGCNRGFVSSNPGLVMWFLRDNNLPTLIHVEQLSITGESMHNLRIRSSFQRNSVTVTGHRNMTN